MNDVDATNGRARARARAGGSARRIPAVARNVGRARWPGMCRHQLATSFPRKALTDPDATLEQAGVRDKDALAVEPKRG